MQELDRRIMLSNCTKGRAYFTTDNDIADVYEHADFFMVDPRTDECQPPGFETGYDLANYRLMFLPVNGGARTQTSRRWGYHLFLILHEKLP
jgi:hypothetical protein